MKDRFYYIESNTKTGDQVLDVVSGNFDKDIINKYKNRIYIYDFRKNIFVPFKKWDADKFKITKISNPKTLKELSEITIGI